MNFAAQKTIYDSDIQAVEAEMPFMFYWLGKTITGQRNEIAETLLGQDSGYLQEYDFEIIVRVSAFGSVRPAQTEDALEIDNTDVTQKDRPRLTLRIKSSKPSPDGVSIVYGVKADN